MTATQVVPPSAPEREIVSTRVFNAAPARVYEAWTDSKQLAAWWGPKGFRNTFHKHEPRPGGKWSFIMHGPNGQDYPNESVYVALTPGELIVFDHVCAPQFRVVATFEPQGTKKDKTKLTFRMIFPSAKEADALRALCVPSNEENFDRLEAVLVKM